jgi:hypothetical protein
MANKENMILELDQQSQSAQRQVSTFIFSFVGD